MRDSLKLFIPGLRSFAHLDYWAFKVETGRGLHTPPPNLCSFAPIEQVGKRGVNG